MAWKLIDPAPLFFNWHLDQKCTHLEAVSNHEIRRLLINEPPGCGKSNTVNVLWNVWEWIKRPHTKFLFASYDASLVGTRDGGKVIRLLQSDWFVARWGRILPPGKPSTSMFETLAGGFRFSTSPGGKGTGRHADIRSIDDPIKPVDAAGGATQTRNALQAVSDWEDNTWSSRATNQTTVRDVLTMQRLHEDDLAAKWKLRGDCVHLLLPMLFDPDRACQTAWGRDIRYKGIGACPTHDPKDTNLDPCPICGKNELLFPERFPLWKVYEMRDKDMGPDVFDAQCQQNPNRKGGKIFRRDWWRFWHYNENVPEPCICDECWPQKRTLPGHTLVRNCVPLPSSGFDVQSWDCAFKKTDTTDMVAGGIFRVYGGRVFLLPKWTNERLSFTQTVNAIRDKSIKNPNAYDKLIEDKANGPAVEDVLKSEIPGIALVNPMGGKDARANAGSIYMSQGLFYLPHPMIDPDVYNFMDQHEKFPRSKFDDLVDMTSQLLVRLRANGTNIDQFALAMARLRGEKK